MSILLGNNHFNVSPSMKIDHVSLNVSDISKSLEFYQSFLGMAVVDRPSNERVLLSAHGSPYLVELLRMDNPSQKMVKRAGLYHFALLLPERKFLADMLVHLGQGRDRVYFEGTADHLVSESIYIRDPDFNGIEIYRDRPSSEWDWDGQRIKMATERLDTEDLLKESTENGWTMMPANTVIGHVHLHVRELTEAMNFYSEVLGLSLTGSYPGAHFFAAGRYHHHIATNTWLGQNIGHAEPGAVGLNHFAIKLPDVQSFEDTVDRLSKSINMVAKEEQNSRSVFIHDFDGIGIQLC